MKPADKGNSIIYEAGSRAASALRSLVRVLRAGVLPRERAPVRRISRAIGNPKPVAKTGNLPQLVRTLVTDYRLRLQGLPSVKFHIENHLDADAELAVSAGELKKALGKLIENAIRGIDGVGEVHIKLTSGNDQIAIAISDNGKGMLPDKVDRIRKNGFNLTKLNASGYGLVDIKFWCEDKNGGFTLESAPKNGTTVYLFLPSARASYDYVLLESDTMIHLLWKKLAELHGKRVLHLRGIHELAENLGELSPVTPFYIDHDLTERLSGLDVAKDLFFQGYRNIYMTLDHQESFASKTTFVRDIVKKDPPWVEPVAVDQANSHDEARADDNVVSISALQL